MNPTIVREYVENIQQNEDDNPLGLTSNSAGDLDKAYTEISEALTGLREAVRKTNPIDKRYREMALAMYAASNSFGPDFFINVARAIKKIFSIINRYSSIGMDDSYSTDKLFHIMEEEFGVEYMKNRWPCISGTEKS